MSGEVVELLPGCDGGLDEALQILEWINFAVIRNAFGLPTQSFSEWRRAREVKENRFKTERPRRRYQ